MIWQEKIDAALDARRVADALRRRYPVAQGAGRWLVADDCQYLNFSSNDYLGLSHHPQIIRAWQQGADQWHRLALYRPGREAIADHQQQIGGADAAGGEVGAALFVQLSPQIRAIQIDMAIAGGAADGQRRQPQLRQRLD